MNVKDLIDESRPSTSRDHPIPISENKVNPVETVERKELPPIIAQNLSVNRRSNIWFNKHIQACHRTRECRLRIFPILQKVDIKAKITSLNTTETCLNVGLANGEIMTYSLDNLELIHSNEISPPYKDKILGFHDFKSFHLIRGEKFIKKLDFLRDMPKIPTIFNEIFNPSSNWLNIIEYKSNAGHYLYFINNMGDIFTDKMINHKRRTPKLRNLRLLESIGPIESCTQLRTIENKPLILCHNSNQFAVIESFTYPKRMKVIKRGKFTKPQGQYHFKIFTTKVFFAPMHPQENEIKNVVLVKTLKDIVREKEEKIELFGKELKFFEVAHKRLVVITKDNYIEIFDTNSLQRISIICTKETFNTIRTKQHDICAITLCKSVKPCNHNDKYHRIKRKIFAATKEGNLFSFRILETENEKLQTYYRCNNCAQLFPEKDDFRKYSTHICIHNLPSIETNNEYQNKSIIYKNKHQYFFN